MIDNFVEIGDFAVVAAGGIHLGLADSSVVAGVEVVEGVVLDIVGVGVDVA